MERHYALVSVKGITENQFQKYLDEFINRMDAENKNQFGATVLGMDEKTGRKITEDLERN